jgi:hypothetical protein
MVVAWAVEGGGCAVGEGHPRVAKGRGVLK